MRLDVAGKQHADQRNSTAPGTESTAPETDPKAPGTHLEPLLLGYRVTRPRTVN